MKFYHFKNSSKKSEIKIDQLGNIKTELGALFFDEATTLKDELKKIQKLKELQLEIIKLNSKLKEIDGKNKCVVFTEDDDVKLLLPVLKASGFRLDETEIYSYQGCSNLSSAKLISKYINKKFPNQHIVVHRDRDYLSIEEVTIWKEALEEVNIHPFITKGTEIEFYYLNPKHINYTHQKIPIKRAEEIVINTVEEKRELSIVNIKKKEFGEKYKR